jgi:hypothetical protein
MGKVLPLVPRNPLTALLTIFQAPVQIGGKAWTPEEKSELISMRRQGMKWEDIARALDKTVRAAQQHYLKLVPPASPSKKRPTNEVLMTEEMKVKLLAAVAKEKPKFWAMVSQNVGNGITPAQCEMEWNDVIRQRK